VADAIRINREFHDLIVSKTTNNWLRQILSNLDDHMRRYRVISNYQEGRMIKSVEEHRQILEAIKHNDAELADEMMRSHLLKVVVDMKEIDFQSEIEKLNRRIQE
jgi:DNA-binding GntR family transcriptional regulator